MLELTLWRVNYHSPILPNGGQINYDAWLILDLEDNNTRIWMWINYGDALQVLPMDLQTGQLINLFDLCQPITDVYCDQLTNESAQFLQHSNYEPGMVLPALWRFILL